MQSGYYSEKLAGRRLLRCYEVAAPRVRQYLEAEIQHALSRLRPTDAVLELGCGYGRVVRRLAEIAHHVVGIDSSRESLALAQHEVGSLDSCHFVCMDAIALAFRAGEFDAVLCLQNGICAFGVDQVALLREALRVLRPKGRCLLSTYGDRFWPHRLAWFEAQAAEGLIGSIDHDACRDGTIACTDGFRSGRLKPEKLKRLCRSLGVKAAINEVDGSSVFCEIIKEGPPAASKTVP